MPLPDRPVANTTIDSAWGQAVHDYTFAPTGCDLYTTTTNTVTTSNTHLNLDLVNEDPAGFLDAANDQAEVPTGAEGLYLIFVRVNSVNGVADDATRAYIFINGVSYASGIEDNLGGTNIQVVVSALVALTAGDIIRIYAQKKGSGTNPTCKVLSLQLVRLGAEYGA